MPRPTRSKEAQEYHKLYRLKRWKDLRLWIFMRDSFTCAMCSKLQGDTSKLVADHKAPHKGDLEIFWDPDNIQTLCVHPCHGRHKQGIESRGYSTQIDPNTGWPTDPQHPANVKS